MPYAGLFVYLIGFKCPCQARSSGHIKIIWYLNINIMNLKMYFCYESYTHLNSSEYFGSDLISVINFHVQIPVHLKLFYAF